MKEIRHLRRPKRETHSSINKNTIRQAIIIFRALKHNQFEDYQKAIQSLAKDDDLTFEEQSFLVMSAIFKAGFKHIENMNNKNAICNVPLSEVDKLTAVFANNLKEQ